MTMNTLLVSNNNKRQFEEEQKENSLPIKRGKPGGIDPSTRSIPDRVLQMIRDNLQKCIKAAETFKWGSPEIKGKRASFLTHFNRLSGSLQVVSSVDTFRMPDPLIPVQFIYESATQLKCNRHELTDELEKLKKGISTTALKILLVTERLLSTCHTFGAKIISEGDEEWISYEGSLLKDKIKALLDEDSSQEIKQIWEAVNDAALYYREFDLGFLIDVRYEANPHDKIWDVQWKSSDFSVNELLVVKRSDRTLRYCQIKNLDEKEIKVAVDKNRGGKIVGNAKLRSMFISRW